jgi:hypothetical protein
MMPLRTPRRLFRKVGLRYPPKHRRRRPGKLRVLYLVSTAALKSLGPPRSTSIPLPDLCSVRAWSNPAAYILLRRWPSPSKVLPRWPSPRRPPPRRTVSRKRPRDRGKPMRTPQWTTLLWRRTSPRGYSRRPKKHRTTIPTVGVSPRPPCLQSSTSRR